MTPPTSPAASAWDDDYTPRAYEAFCRRHRRYRTANATLVAHAALEPGQRVLDVAAGTGRTAEAALVCLGDRGSVSCVEPSIAMRARGAARLAGRGITWLEVIPSDGTRFERVLCGAAIWQIGRLETAIATLSALVAPGGALVFNIPAQYVQEPDPPGGGRDPWLVELPTLVDRSGTTATPDWAPTDFSSLPPSRDDILRYLVRAGLRPREWEFEVRLSQAAYRDWLKIPPVSEGLLRGLPPVERARRLDEAFGRSDPRSWRRERWLGWTAWRDR